MSNFAVEFKNVYYKIGNFELKNISFCVEKGEIFGIAGSNGSGKTTVFRLMVNLIRPYAGDIYIDGIKVEKSTNKKIRSKIGFLFQNPDEQLFTPSVYEDVAFGLRNMNLNINEIEERVNWALKAVNILEYKNDPPNTLSWGLKKRAALASILAMKPEILLLDEPFANLDIKTVIELLKILKELKNTLKITIIFASHDQEIIQNWSNRVIVLNKGSLIYYGSSKNYINNNEVKTALGSIEELLNLIKT